MIPFYVMLAAIASARAIGAFGWTPLDSWPVAVRVGLAAMFVFTGVVHFTRTREDLIRMVPPALPNPSALVSLTGIAEFMGAIGLLVPGLASWAGYGLILLLVAMFPANVHAARSGHTIAGRRHTPMWLRLPLQLVWIGLLCWSTNRAA